jgi:hypothetical protein
MYWEELGKAMGAALINLVLILGTVELLRRCVRAWRRSRKRRRARRGRWARLRP